MRTRWKIVWILLAGVLIAAAGIRFIYAHGLRVADAQRDRIMKDVRFAYENHPRKDERPPLGTLHARIADPGSMSSDEIYEAIILIATYGVSPESSKVLVQFIERESPAHMRQFVMLKPEALMVLGITGGDSATALLKAVFLSEDNVPPLLLQNWLREAKEASSIDEDAYWMDLARGRAAIGLMASGPEGDAFVRDYFFKRRAAFENNYLPHKSDEFLFTLVDSLDYADKLKAFGPMLLMDRFNQPVCGVDQMLVQSKYRPRMLRTVAERIDAIRQLPAKFAYTFKAGWNDLLVGQH